MPTEVIMPKVDMDMTEGTIVTWHVAEGEAVEKGQPLFDIETAKAAMEVEAPADGLFHHPVAEGTVVPIGQPVAWLYAAGEEVGPPPAVAAPAAAAAPAEPALAGAEVSAPSEPMRAPEPPMSRPAPVADRPRATPAARSLARQGGISLDRIPGTGPSGRVQAGDVRAWLDSAASPSPTLPAVSYETGALAVHRSRGGTGTPVLLIHGFASDSTSWVPLEAHLKHRPLIRIDLPSHGKSPRLRIDSFADLAAEIRRAFDGLGVEKVDLIGHSLGGALALSLADTRPRSIASLTLIAPAGLGPQINGDALTGICRATRVESLKPWLGALVADDSLISDAYARAAMASRNDPAQRAAQARLADVVFPDGVQSFDLKAALDRLDMPTRMIWGRQDAILPWKHALRAPGQVALHFFDGVGHMPQFECAEEVGKLLRAAL
ncbi:acetoin dehydrogenase dihydrolipoyllysine-residue acetyltransferase subunit [Loktanella sp. IMCC34160]|uniref:acetoin dehydrogenase dihydrolipoyllysine-residue acetyltransferase subunit n=1 Tax=Loktanella sp. IMCC34160 TaxID=2510646 RepID=UPI00101D77BD|nr:acetoin dehydrogenase dihydrolipoyllysine-residue acetyltransferase subunit [Loktanella sp. IMCC34160]RYG93088.1 acetoin dehydrogenase dihydrolipoyllysine-residue acetyltransferase subunit [Loktanella sp. IMCC34160]